MFTLTTRGNIARVINDDEDIFSGDLSHYFKIVFLSAKNVLHPYHNFRHMLHVTILCYEAAFYYYDLLTPRQTRNLLIAALFHDFDHSGKQGNDAINIARAVAALKAYILPEDQSELEDIVMLMNTTEYPYQIPSTDLELRAQILRDADAAQCLSEAWLQQVVFGLGAEWDENPDEVLAKQPSFLAQLEFQTNWARELFPQSVIYEKIAEAEDILRILRSKRKV